MKLYSFLVSLALSVSANSYAEQTSQCSQIVDRAERLECFDREFPNDIEPSTKPQSSAKASQPLQCAAEPVNNVIVADESTQEAKKKLSLGVCLIGRAGRG